MLLASCVAHAPVATPGARATIETPVPTFHVAGEAQPPIYLFDLMAHPDFAAALHALPQSAALPAWVWRGGTATPASIVQVAGVPLQLASACKPHACPLERIALLCDAARHTVRGLYVSRPEAAVGRAAPDDDTRDTLLWLGTPDAGQREALHAALYPR